MPEEEKNENQEQTQETPEAAAEESKDAQEKGMVAKLLPWIIMSVVVAIAAGGGFAVASLLAKPDPTEQQQTSETTQGEESELEEAEEENLEVDPENKADAKSWFYNEFPPAIANLNEPDVTRYIRVSLILELSKDLDQTKGAAVLAEKTPILVNWLTIFLAGRKLDEVRGEESLRKLQMQIKDAFNEKVFEENKPYIKNVLFKEFAIQ